ncbi:hypothetical protein BT63DRAFT_454717 [Microthyrium microscopicum]|uniref:Uncharacterized protein n=1 Tax=Microthyrium microscopicum TaxID=703497 RepID=A0A6A6UGF4_9PEZI|nr:hypothetical protein BT63DRAFT_454717 [Microthyrium microscopicum]
MPLYKLTAVEETSSQMQRVLSMRKRDYYGPIPTLPEVSHVVPDEKHAHLPWYYTQYDQPKELAETSASTPLGLLQHIFGWILFRSVDLKGWAKKVDIQSQVWDFLRRRAYGIHDEDNPFEPRVPDGLDRDAWIEWAEADLKQLSLAVTILEYISLIQDGYNGKPEIVKKVYAWLISEIKALLIIKRRMQYRLHVVRTWPDHYPHLNK